MDCGNDYIKMCHKAKEIQELYYKMDYQCENFAAYIEIEVFCPYCQNCLSEYDRGAYCSDCGTKTTSRHNYKVVTGRYINDKDIWLPRQDQLQEILGPFINVFQEVVVLRQFCYNFFKINKYIPKSMEQLWLIFVYHKKFHKKWNGEDWIKEI
jgi:hypothetical protein